MARILFFLLLPQQVVVKAVGKVEKPAGLVVRGVEETAMQRLVRLEQQIKVSRVVT
jgi:glutamine amidotransferase PdxT